jgi:hypothetical protein
MPRYAVGIHETGIRQVHVIVEAPSAQAAQDAVLKVYNAPGIDPFDLDNAYTDWELETVDTHDDIADYAEAEFVVIDGKLVTAGEDEDEGDE